MTTPAAARPGGARPPSDSEAGAVWPGGGPAIPAESSSCGSVSSGPAASARAPLAGRLPSLAPTRSRCRAAQRGSCARPTLRGSLPRRLPSETAALRGRKGLSAPAHVAARSRVRPAVARAGAAALRIGPRPGRWAESWIASRSCPPSRPCGIGPRPGPATARRRQEPERDASGSSFRMLYLGRIRNIWTCVLQRAK